MIHEYNVFCLSDDGRARFGAVTFMDIFRYTNGNQIGFVTLLQLKGATPIYIPAGLVEFIALTKPADGFIARAEITLTDGRVYILNLMPEGNDAFAGPFLPFCSCSSGTNNSQFVYMTGLTTGNNVGGPVSLGQVLPAQPVAGVWHIQCSVNWNVKVLAPSAGFLPQNRGDNFQVQVFYIDGGTSPWRVASADNSIGETINANVTDIDGQVQMAALVPTIAGQAPKFQITYARTDYIDSLGNNLSLSLACNANLTLTPSGAKAWAYAFFVETVNPIVVI
jgi:hypothetical protein